MVEVIYLPGSKIRIFSGFNIVATDLFEGFILKKSYFTVTLIMNTSLKNQSKINYAYTTHVIMYW